MGFDRIRFFDGADGNSTLVSADKASAEVLYGYNFSSFARMMGYTTRHIVDAERVGEHDYLKGLVNSKRYQVAAFPDTAKEIWYNAPLADIAVELRPPLSETASKILSSYLEVHCRPNDAGPLYLDHRESHNGCSFSPQIGSAQCHDSLPLQTTEEIVPIDRLAGSQVDTSNLLTEADQ